MKNSKFCISVCHILFFDIFSITLSFLWIKFFLKILITRKILQFFASAASIPLCYVSDSWEIYQKIKKKSKHDKFFHQFGEFSCLLVEKFHNRIFTLLNGDYVSSSKIDRVIDPMSDLILKGNQYLDDFVLKAFEMGFQSEAPFWVVYFWAHQYSNWLNCCKFRKYFQFKTVFQSLN